MNALDGSRTILIHGMLLVLVGLLFGLVVPATPHPNLMLFIVLATVLLTLPHRVGAKSIWVMVASAWLTWAMAFSQVANAWWRTKRTLPIAASQAGVSGGEPLQELIVTLTHLLAGVGLIAAWGLLVIRFLRSDRRATPA